MFRTPQPAHHQMRAKCLPSVVSGVVRADSQRKYDLSWIKSIRRRSVGSSNTSRRQNDLIETLVDRTRKLMHDNGKSRNNRHKHVVAFSGGVDSSLVALLVLRAARPDEDEVLAVIGRSNALSEEQYIQASEVAKHIGIEFHTVDTAEGNDSEYIANTGAACRACKTHLYSTLRAISAHHGGDTSLVSLYNGTNADDLKDSTRVGLLAANKFNVRSPLRDINKSEVRLAARALGLPNWNFAASPCLRSRLSLGVPATAEHLQRIELAERFVRSQIRELTVVSNLRVRLLSGNRACIEVDHDSLRHIEEKVGDWHVFFKDKGFASVSARAFRSGSVASP